MLFRYIDKECIYNKVVPAPGASCLVHTNAGNVQWIHNGKLKNEISVGGQTDYAPMGLTFDGQILLYGTKSGSILSQVLSSSQTEDEPAGDSDVFCLHNNQVTFLKISQDASFVVTCDTAGNVILSKLQHVSEGVLTDSAHKPKDMAHQYSLVSMEDVMAWNARVSELERAILTERKNAEYLVRRFYRVLLTRGQQ